jgi:ABC-type polysaccharide/polyol phosphate export permease
MNYKKQFTIISTLTVSEMKGRYRNTWAGFLWVIINPILMFSVHALVFKHILKLNMDRYYVFLLGGLLPWLFINSTLTMTCNAFITNREILLSFQINPLMILASKVIDNFINFISPFILLFLVLLFQEGFSIYGVLSLPISMLSLIIGTFAMSMFFATLQVYFRDTQFILSFGLSILYFLTPIFYPAEMVPSNISWIIDINPVYAIINPLQIALWNYESHALINALLKSLFFNINIIFVSTYFWRKKRNELYLYI